jgi:acyl-coenzyme A synthetase/AMP-(fatty) acid ligase
MIAVHAEGAAPEVPAAMNLARHVLAGADAHPDRIALILLRSSGAERWSYGRLAAAVRGIATGLAARGLAPGDRVLLRLADGVAVPLAFLGAIAAGLVPVPTSAALTAHEIGGIAARLRPRLVVAGPGVALPDPAPCPVLEAPALLAMERLPPAGWHIAPADSPAYIVMTSGTSGRPQAVVHAHRAILARRMMHAAWEGIGPGDRLLHAGAMGWTYTLGTGLLDPWTVGATALAAPGVPLETLPMLMRRFAATVLAATPGHFRRLLRTGLPPLPRLRHGLSAGEALPEALRQAWRAATGTDLHQALGMTEISTYVSGGPGRPAPPGSAGWPQPGRRVAVLGPDGRPVARGETGVLAVDRRDPGLLLGYDGDPEATAAHLSGDWFVTGDLARMQADGSIVSLGRADALMNAGGHRVSPAEVEAAFDGLPGLSDCAALEVAVADGVSVVALAWTGAAGIGEADLAARAAERLARWKQPRLYVPLPALPRTAAGKLDRRALAGAVAAAVAARAAT